MTRYETNLDSGIYSVGHWANSRDSKPQGRDLVRTTDELGVKHVNNLMSYTGVALMYEAQERFKEGAKAALHVLKGLQRKIATNLLLLSRKKQTTCHYPAKAKRVIGGRDRLF